MIKLKRNHARITTTGPWAYIPDLVLVYGAVVVLLAAQLTGWHPAWVFGTVEVAAVLMFLCCLHFARETYRRWNDITDWFDAPSDSGEWLHLQEMYDYLCRMAIGPRPRWVRFALPFGSLLLFFVLCGHQSWQSYTCAFLVFCTEWLSKLTKWAVDDALSLTDPLAE